MKTMLRMMALWLTLGSLAPADGSGKQETVAQSAPGAADGPPVSIEVEVLFLEIAQEDLEQLGIQWMIGSHPDGTDTNSPDRKKIGHSISNTPSAPVHPGVAGMLSITNILTNPELSRILHALEQRDGANLLSAPKVTTLSGNNAEIKVVREVFYPVEYDVQVAVRDKTSGKINVLSSCESASASNQVMSAVGIPKFAMRETGVILNVTPTADPDGKTIHLTLLPQVVELVEWIDFGNTMRYADGSSQEVKMLQPVFHCRSVNSRISIQDGQTAVIGGLVKETQETMKDQIPYLSKIPGLGKFFRSQTTKNIKRHLLILVTARRVDLAGKPIGTAKGN